MPPCGATGGMRRFPPFKIGREADECGHNKMKVIESMRTAICLLLLCLAPLAMAQAGSGYKLNPGDLLRIDVWNEESLSREMLILPDGQLSFPLAGNLKAGGLTVAELEDALAEALGKYLKDKPTVTVAVAELRGNKIYVLGKVNRPGEFPINRPTDVMQALAMAGGLNTFAAENDINVLRRDEAGKQVAIPFEYGEVKGGDELQTNILLQSGDVVVVQ